MDMSLSSSDCDRHSNDPDEDLDLINHRFNQQLDLQYHDDDKDHKNCENEEDDEEDDDEGDDDDDFTFMIVGEDEAYDDKVFEDGKIRPVFPLFDQNLLKEDEEYDIEEIDTLPILPPVDKIFIESPRGFPTSSTASKHDDAATGPYCTWSKETTELTKKSNSTGFSKLWRLKEKVGRSNSDGRDAFVFLKTSDKPTTSSSSSSKPPVTSFVTKAKKPAVSAHEAYLRSKGHTEEERRRSYLPYRPELMGIFTNAHVGLTKNVHPY